MQNRFDLLVTDVMPIYMIMPRYSHNYATSETYGPRVYSHHINLHHFYIVLLFTLLLLFTLHLYTKNNKKYYIYQISLS